MPNLENHAVPAPDRSPSNRRAQAVLRAPFDLQTLVGELSAARARTDALFAAVPASLLYTRPIAERHRLLFYIGHLEAFDANLLLREPATNAPAAAFARRFAFGIDPVDGQLPSDRAEDWPGLAALHASARRTRERVDEGLDQAPESLRDVPLSTLLHTAIEHRLMHAETLAYLLNRLPIERPLRATPARHRIGAADDDNVVPIPAGVTTLGTSPGATSFGWDNEFPAQHVTVAAFEIDRYMVTNAQFLRFVEADGYRDSRWWTPEDWNWIEARGITHPASWQLWDGDWCQVSRADRVAFQGDWPAYVSHAEAAAYARWAGKRLPTEAEWQRAAYGDAEGDEHAFPWGRATPDARHGNFACAQWDPASVEAHPAGTSAFGVAGLLGNGWEWTSSVFAPFPGFQPAAYYPGYSATFFDGRHFVLKGGSAHTAKRLLRASFRNWFQPHYPFPFAGFRCVGTS